MPDDPTPTPTPDPPADPDPAPDPAAPADPHWDPDAHDPGRASATITKLRQAEKDGKAAARERDQLAARLKEIEDADKSELDKAQQRLAEYEARERQWETERRETTLRLAVIERQQQLGIKSPGLALAALDRDGIEWDDGKPVNLDDQLAALLEREPLLKGEAAPPPPPKLDGNAGTGGGDSHGLTVAEIEVARSRGMSPDQYARMKGVENLDDYEKLQAQAAPQHTPATPAR